VSRNVSVVVERSTARIAEGDILVGHRSCKKA
jgi:hypothetical protein